MKNSSSINSSNINFLIKNYRENYCNDMPSETLNKKVISVNYDNCLELFSPCQHYVHFSDGSINHYTLKVIFKLLYLSDDPEKLLFQFIQSNCGQNFVSNSSVLNIDDCLLINNFLELKKRFKL